MKTLKSMRLTVGFFGKTNVGKSSVINKIAGQNVSIVSDIAGTTTDIVEKSMELLPIGPITLLDTAGLDDKTNLAQKRIDKTLSVINRCDIAVIICDFNGLNSYENNLIENLKKLNIPYIIMMNKCDEKKSDIGKDVIYTSAKTDNDLIFKFTNAIIKLLPEDFINSPKILTDLIKPKDTVILVTPIDKEAPKSRLILPQVQTIRDILDGNCLAYVVKETELQDALDNLKEKPALVVTDSQAFKTVAQIVPKDIPLTSFSILFARLKGDLDTFIKGTEIIENLKDNDKILILESCTHHTIEDDIGTVKIPNLLKKKTGKNLIFEHYSGHDFPDITPYSLVIHCGACMTNRREVLSRILIANNLKIPITNYGVVISYCLGILPRATKIFTSSI